MTIYSVAVKKKELANFISDFSLEVQSMLCLN